MIKFDITHDIKAAQKALGKMQKQIPFATSQAINKTLVDIQKVEKAAIKVELDNPTKQVVDSIRIVKSSTKKMFAKVYIVKGINKFLMYQIHGGVRRPKIKSEAVPYNLKLNAFGNIGKRHSGRVPKLSLGKKTFVARIKGIDGVWRRKGGKTNPGVNLLVAFEKSVKYKKTFTFYEHAERTVKKRWARNFNRAISHAIRTAR